MGHMRKQLAALAKSDKERLRLMLEDSKSRGDYFFSEETMAFWGSAVVGGVFENNTFVTIEDNFNRTKKLYTARHYNWDRHSVETIGAFQQFDNWGDAIIFAKAYKEENSNEKGISNQGLEG